MMAMMWVAFVSYVVVNIPAGYLLAFPCGLGVVGLYLAFSIGLILAASLFAWNFYKVMRRVA